VGRARIEEKHPGFGPGRSPLTENRRFRDHRALRHCLMNELSPLPPTIAVSVPKDEAAPLWRSTSCRPEKVPEILP
jgi:hypothetical protein